MAQWMVIGGFHAVLAALEDGAEKPLEIWLSASRQDERPRRVMALAHSLPIPLQQRPRSDVSLRATGWRDWRQIVHVPEGQSRNVSLHLLMDMPFGIAPPDGWSK